MTESPHLLAIVSPEQSGALRDALLHWRSGRLVVEANIWSLYALPQHENFEIAILHHSLSMSVVREAAQYVRRRWPQAKILLIGAGTNALDDPLYDERILPGLSQDILLAALNQMAGGDRGKE